MPNHIHMVLYINEKNDATNECIHPNLGCLKPPLHGEECSDYHHNSPLAVIIGTFKAAVTRTARARCIAPLQGRIWQRLFHEHIIRHPRAYDNIMNYIDNNVENWAYDCFHPSPIPNAPWAK